MSTGAATPGTSTLGTIGGPCQDRSGFLFPHACSRIATGVCQSCNRAVCAQHTSVADGLAVCATCLKKGLRQRQAREQPLPETVRADDRPYYYGYGRYHGWGYYGASHWSHHHHHHDHDSHHDAHDFTEADAASLTAGDESWETDMGAS